VTSRVESVAPEIVGAVRAGATFPAACAQAGVSAATARTWAQKGRKDPEGRYGGFARDLDAAREAAAPARTDMDRPEFEQHLARAVRGGSVQAMKLWADLHRPGEAEEPAPDAFAEVDDLAKRRAARV
jgi:hypothetical protein